MLQRLAYKLQAFMYGRNGVDQLGWALLILGIVLNLAGNIAGWAVLCLLAYVPMLLAIYRMFSKNLPQRQKENAWLLKLFHRGGSQSGSYQSANQYSGGYQSTARQKPKSVGVMERLRDRDHKYFACPRCSQTVRVPKGRGVIRITCPKCGERFEKKS